MKITLVISSLSAGGAERVMSLMANYWSRNGDDVTLITLADKSSDFYILDERVRRVGLDYEFPSNNKIFSIYFNLKKIYLLRNEIKKAESDVVISFMDKMNVIGLISSIGLQLPVMISERIDPKKYNIGFLWRTLRYIVYPFADRLIVQNPAIKKWALSRWPGLPVSVIANPVHIPARTKHKSFLDSKFKWCLAIGRLTEQKGFDLLLSAFARVKEQDVNDTWRLLILGEGELRAELTRQVELLHLNDLVLMPGRVNNPEDYLKQADLFVLSSRFEGFPNALLEAMACGLPVISTNCPSGPEEIISHNIDGILVENENDEALAKAMYELMTDKEKGKRLAEEAQKSVSRFHPDKIMKQWGSVIYEVRNVRS